VGVRRTRYNRKKLYESYTIDDIADELEKARIEIDDISSSRVTVNLRGVSLDIEYDDRRGIVVKHPITGETITVKRDMDELMDYLKRQEDQPHKLIAEMIDMLEEIRLNESIRYRRSKGRRF